MVLYLRNQAIATPNRLALYTACILKKHRATTCPFSHFFSLLLKGIGILETVPLL